MKGPLAALLALVLATGTAMAADEGMFRPATQVSNVALQHSQSVGVILNETTQAALMHHDVATRKALEAVRGSLQQQFASVQFYPSLDRVMMARPQVIVVLKTASRSGGLVQAQFFDANLTYITQLHAPDAQFDASLKALVVANP
ncbi:hypothetical protein RAM80_06290 [Pseudomonas sp. App30]|uniref:hypothetical protein n=1 Tax=Pseudomonas sp. App30 TaxID=3068990 RepID=UPI003A8030FC